jgi:hypothetical protein
MVEPMKDSGEKMAATTTSALLLHSLLGVYEATNDVNTSLDETFLLQEDSLKSIDRNMIQQLSEIIQKEKQNLHQLPNEDLVSQTLKVISQLKTIGDEAKLIESDIVQKLTVFQPKVDEIKRTEQELEELQQLAKILRSLSKAKTLKDLLGNKNSSVEAKCEALFEIIHLYSMFNVQKLRPWLKTIIDEYFEKMKQDLEIEVNKQMKALSWPITPIKFDKTSALCRFIGLLTWLQIGIEDIEGILQLGANEVLSELWSIQLIARPCIIRFQYHFSSDKATNRVDRPEWFVAYIVQSVRDIAPFFEKCVQPALSFTNKIGPSEEATSSKQLYVDVLSQFIKILVKAVHNRLDQTWQVLEGDDALICHTMDELLAGDRTLAGEFGYGSSASWTTMAGFFWGSDDAKTQSWLKADLRYARQRFAEIMNSKTCWQPLSFAIGSSSTNDKVRPSLSLMDVIQNDKDFTTECADAVMAMIDALGSRIDLCKVDSVRELEIRTRFVEDVQCTLIKDFALLVIKRQSIAEKCNTLYAMQETIEEWELKPRYADIKRSETSKVGSTLLLGKVVGRTLNVDEDNINNESTSWVFSPYLSYVRKLLSEETESEASRVFYRVTPQLKDWEKKVWTFGIADMPTLPFEEAFGQRSADQRDSPVEISQEISNALSYCKENLSLWLADIHPIVRSNLVFSLAQELEEYLVDYIFRRMFSATGSRQFHSDFTALCELFRPFLIDSFTTGGRKSPMEKFFPQVSFIVKVLTLSIKDLKRILAGDDSVLQINIGIANVSAIAVAKLRVGVV